VDVGGWHHAQLVHANEAEQLRQQVDRQEVHRVQQPDPDENGDGQWGDHIALDVESRVDGVVDDFHHEFDEVLQLARHAGGGFAGSQPEHQQENQTQCGRNPEGVQVERIVVRAQVAQVVLDVFGGSRRSRVAPLYNVFSGHKYI